MNNIFFIFLLLFSSNINISLYGETFNVCSDNSNSPCQLLQESYFKPKETIKKASHELQKKITITAESIDLIKNELNDLFKMFKDPVKDSPLKNLHMGYNVIAFLETVKQYAEEYQLIIPDNFLTVKIGDIEYNLNDKAIYREVIEKLGFKGEFEEIKNKIANMSEKYRDKLQEKIDTLNYDKKIILLRTLTEQFPVVMKEKVTNVLNKEYRTVGYRFYQGGLLFFNDIASEIKKILK